MGIKDLDEEFQEGPRGFKEREMGLIPGRVDVGKHDIKEIPEERFQYRGTKQGSGCGGH